MGVLTSQDSSRRSLDFRELTKELITDAELDRLREPSCRCFERRASAGSVLAAVDHRSLDTGEALKERVSGSAARAARQSRETIVVKERYPVPNTIPRVGQDSMTGFRKLRTWLADAGKPKSHGHA